ncbi:MAG: AEC family transporter [Motiliproteus sp.]
MLTTYNALIPIIAAIFLGYGLRRGRFFSDSFWLGVEQLTYYVLTPILLIHALTANPLDSLPWKSFLLCLDTTILFCTLLLVAWQRWIRPLDASSFTSLFQGGIRFNTFIALALTNALFGEEGLLYAALASAGMIILINILCVAVFSISLPQNRFSAGNMLRQLATNPLILGCLIGLSLNLTGIDLPSAAKETFSLIGRAAFPIGLLAVGAGLEIRRLTQDWELTLVSSVVQFLIKPLMAFLFTQLFGLNGLPAAIVILFLAVPTAPSSYILSRQLGGNYQAMAAIITFQTLSPLSRYRLPFGCWVSNNLTGSDKSHIHCRIKLA